MLLVRVSVEGVDEREVNCFSTFDGLFFFFCVNDMEEPSVFPLKFF